MRMTCLISKVLDRNCSPSPLTFTCLGPFFPASNLSIIPTHSTPSTRILSGVTFQGGYRWTAHGIHSRLWNIHMVWTLWFHDCVWRKHGENTPHRKSQNNFRTCAAKLLSFTSSLPRNAKNTIKKRNKRALTLQDSNSPLWNVENEMHLFCN